MFASAAAAVSKALRGSGQALDRLGRVFEVNPYVDTVLPSTRMVAFKKTMPKVEKSVFISPSATVIGDVTLGHGSSVWYGAVIRGTLCLLVYILDPYCCYSSTIFYEGDVNSIKIGRGVTVGDRAMIHCSGDLHKPSATSIGDNVTIGAGAIVHGCILESECFIGEGAQVLDGARVMARAMVAPGSVLSGGKTVLTGQVWAGVPAAYSRDLTAEEMASLASVPLENAKLASAHAFECGKSWQQLELDEEERFQTEERADYYYKRLSEEEMSKREGEVQNHMVPGRILDSPSKSLLYIYYSSYSIISLTCFFLPL